jgi:hypothetical protein
MRLYVGLDEVPTSRIEMDFHTPTNKLAHSLGISGQIVVKQAWPGLGMKRFHLR